MAGHAFISYSRHDREYAEALAAFLSQLGIRVWTDRGISFGQNWRRETERAIREAAAIILLMSPSADQSQWVTDEIRFARRLGKPILPILLDGRPMFLVSDLHYEDARTGNMPSTSFVDQLRQLMVTVVPAPAENVRGLVNKDATKIFISYRRADSAFGAHWLHRELVHWFAQDGTLDKDSFFIDVDSIHPGRRFRDAVQQAIEQCQVLLVVIGDRWLTAETEGLRRIDAPNDMVRQEIELGLKNGVTLVPVLLAPATMPDARLLPESIQELTEFQGITVAPERFHEAVQFLAPTLKQIIGL